MNTASIAPEVAQFASAVRAQLADLTPDEREELAGGLEADLADLVDERGVEALGEPVAYAQELRGAAGLPPAMGKALDRRPLGEAIDARLDLGRERWDRAVTGLPGSPWEFVTSLRPAWWLLRAYVAVQTLDYALDGNYDLAWVPTLGGLEWPLLIVAAVLSVQLGRGRLWPAAGWALGLARLVLLALNVLAVVMIVPIFGSLPNVSWQSIGYAQADPVSSGAGITSNGNDVSNIYPYDAEGQPLVGVQLFDQDGKPLKVDEFVQGGDYSTWAYPWTNVNGKVWNAFPMPEAKYDTAGYCCDRMPSPWTSDTPPTFPRPPLDQVPSVSIPEAAYGDRAEAEVSEATPEKTPRDKAGQEQKRKAGQKSGDDAAR
ncbi:hypothetical protein [Nocardioides sp. LHG3406-4]|uniref:hypothetical protein n=1 Tax=Nocardioides sp. LHG3406-4 TaxID=2804575 RepID=UPI003CE83394